MQQAAQHLTGFAAFIALSLAGPLAAQDMEAGMEEGHEAPKEGGRAVQVVPPDSVNVVSVKEADNA